MLHAVPVCTFFASIWSWMTESLRQGPHVPCSNLYIASCYPEWGTKVLGYLVRPLEDARSNWWTAQDDELRLLGNADRGQCDGKWPFLVNLPKDRDVAEFFCLRVPLGARTWLEMMQSWGCKQMRRRDEDQQKEGKKKTNRRQNDHSDDRKTLT